MTNDAKAPVDRRGKPRLLVVDDQMPMAETLADGLSERGFDATPMDSSREAARVIQDFDVLVTDLRMPELDGIGLLEISKQLDAGRPVIIMTAYSAVDSAIDSIRRGAYHYLTKPFKVDELALFVDRALDEARLRRETASLRRALREHYSAGAFVAESEAMREVSDLVKRVADTAVPVLINRRNGDRQGARGASTTFQQRTSCRSAKCSEGTFRGCTSGSDRASCSPRSG